MGRREEFYVLNVGANISRQGLRVWGTEGKGGGLGRGSSRHVLGSAPRQLRGSAPVTAASVSPSAPGVASEGKLCVAGSLWPGHAFSAYVSVSGACLPGVLGKVQ